MADAEARILIRAVDRVTAPIKRINASVDRMTRPLRRVRDAVARIGQVAGLGKLAGGLRGVGAAASGLAGHLGGVLGPLAALGGAASVAGLGSIITDFASTADEASKFARQIGLSTEALTELQYAADRQGVSQEAFNTSMGAFGKRLGELKAGTGSLNSLLGKVNPAFAQQLKLAGSTEEAFGMMMQALQNLEDPGKRAALAAAAFGRSGQEMTRMAEAGADGLAQLRQDARDLGLVISNEAGTNAESFVDTVTRFQGALTGVSNSIATKVMPVLQPLLDKLTAWIVANRELIAQKVHAVVDRIATALRAIDWASVIAGLRGFMDRIQSVVQSVGGWENVLIGLIAVMNAGMIGAILQVGRAIVGLGGILLANPILAIVAAIAGAVYAIYANWDGIVAWFQGKLAAVTAAFESGFLAGVWEVFAQFQPVRLVADAVNGLIDWLFGVNLYEVGAQFIGGLWDGIGQQWDKLTAWLSDAIRSLTDWMPDWVKKRLGLDVSVTGAPDAPDRPESASASTRALTDRVMGAARQAAAPATAAALALSPPAAPPVESPVIQTDTVTVEGSPASPSPASAQVSSPSHSQPTRPDGATAVNTTVHMTVNGAVEPDALRRAVETAVDAAVRRALDDARHAQAAEARSSLYD